MSVEPRPIPKWTALEGTVLPGGYEIEHCLSANNSDALFKLRILGDRFTEALVRVFAPNALPAEQIEWWRHAVTLRHRHLSSPLSAGFTAIDTAQLAYIACVRPDETLDGVLAERSLTPEETREALSACLSALEYLHDAGWIHSALAPAEILAFGDDIRLSAARLRPITQAAVSIVPEAIPAPRYLAPESKSANTTPAADMYCLGASIFEVLTRNQFAPGSGERIATLSHPFSAIIEACVNPDPKARPTVQQVRTLLNSPAPPRVPKPVPAPVPAEAPVEVPKVVATPKANVETLPGADKPRGGDKAVGADKAPTPVERPIPAPRTPAAASPLVVPPPVSAGAASATPARAAEQPRPSNPPVPAGSTPRPAPLTSLDSPPRRRTLEPEEDAHSESVWFGMPLRKWLYLAAALVALIVVLWVFHPRRSRPPQGPSASLAATNSEAPESGTATGSPAQPVAKTPPAKWPSHVAQPAGAAASSAARTASVPPVAANPNASWRVVAYTFNREADAQRRVNALKAEHPALDANVYSPAGSGSPYLVVLGGPMTKLEAERLRSRAKASGLPRDTFVRNYSR